MAESYLELLQKTLKRDERLVSEDGQLLKSKITELARKLDAQLIESILGVPELKSLFFTNIGDVTVFDKDKFITFVQNEAFLPDSWTAYKIEIGLGQDRDTFIKDSTDVVLNWPYKDGVLEGGQTKEDQKREEIFWNEVLGANQRDVLLAPKVLDGFKRFTKTGEEAVKELTENDNFVLRGNNLLALHTLKKRYAGKVKLIYIDTPFNTEKDSFKYNDKFTRSTWLTFMKNRLEIAWELLDDDGSICVQIDYNQAHYLKVMMDELFGEANFRNNIVWQYYMGGKGEREFARKHDDILFYSRKPGQNKFNKIKVKRYLDFKPSLNDDSADGESGHDDIGYYSIVTAPDVWSDIRSVFNMSREYRGFSTQKPEALLQRIIEVMTDPGDLVLDFNLGSGTTAVVAHKMGRRFIGVEQLDYDEIDPVATLQKVVSGEDQGGISEAVDWHGGGSFVYAYLKDDVNVFIEAVKRARNADELLELLHVVEKSNFLSYRVDPTKLHEAEFKKLPEPQQKSLLIDLVDKNKLYVNYHDIDDASYKIPEATKRLNQWLQSRD